MGYDICKHDLGFYQFILSKYNSKIVAQLLANTQTDTEFSFSHKNQPQVLPIHRFQFDRLNSLCRLSKSTDLLKKFFEMDIFQGIWKNMEVALKSLVYNYMNLKMELVRDWTLVDENSKSTSKSISRNQFWTKYFLECSRSP